MRNRLKWVIEQYGQTVTLVPQHGSEPLKIRAFLQPILKKQDEPPVAVTPLGPVCEQRWLYIGRANVDIRVGDLVNCGGMRLAVQETQSVYWKNEVLYRRAILRRKKEAAV